VSHYRAAAVLDFFDEQALSLGRLRELSQRQTSRLVQGLVGRGGLHLVSPRSATERGGFVALRVPGASEVVAELRRRGVYADSRGDVLRLGPAPYVTDDELDRAVVELRTIVRA
jgi:kynureninase